MVESLYRFYKMNAEGHYFKRATMKLRNDGKVKRRPKVAVVQEIRLLYRAGRQRGLRNRWRPLTLGGAGVGVVGGTTLGVSGKAVAIRF
jgi:hypothetical protein